MRLRSGRRSSASRTGSRSRGPRNPRRLRHSRAPPEGGAGAGSLPRRQAPTARPAEDGRERTGVRRRWRRVRPRLQPRPRRSRPGPKRGRPNARHRPRKDADGSPKGPRSRGESNRRCERYAGRGSVRRDGRVRLMAAVLKTVRVQALASSNLAPSATPFEFRLSVEAMFDVSHPGAYDPYLDPYRHRRNRPNPPPTKRTILGIRSRCPRYEEVPGAPRLGASDAWLCGFVALRLSAASAAGLPAEPPHRPCVPPGGRFRAAGGSAFAW